MHWPLRLLETGNIEVKVLFVLASQVFLLSAINGYFPNDSTETIVLQIYGNSVIKSEAYLTPHKNDISSLTASLPAVSKIL